MKTIILYWKVLRKAALDFNDDNGFKLSASLSYSTLFALAPLLIVIISLAGLILGRPAAEGRIYEQIRDLVGSNAAMQIQDIIKNTRQYSHTSIGAIIGAILLIITATGIFTEIQGSVNYMWAIQVRPEKGWLKFLVNRLLSFSLILGFGLLTMASLLVNSLVNLLGDRLKDYFFGVSVYFFYAVNILLTLIAIILLSMVIFSLLPDAVIRWKDALRGAVFTAVFFELGRYLIGLYLVHSNIGVVYGTAASIMVILTWVYYSSVIFYLGAEFTKVYAIEHGGRIRPSRIAVFIIKREAKELD